jgi:LemA protein
MTRLGEHMNAFKKTLLIFAAIIVLSAVYLIGIYNVMVSRYQGVKAAWSQVENTYQRRADLIPNLVKTVKGYAVHEKETLIQVVKARTTAMQTQQAVNPAALPTATQLQQIESNQQALSASLGRLFVVVERYPDLKASQNFLALQAELAGTENRIAVERRRFNLAAQSYNTTILQFPQHLLANYFNFEPAAYFSAKPNADVAPQVDF